MALPVIAPSRRGLNFASSSRRATISLLLQKSRNVGIPKRLRLLSFHYFLTFTSHRKRRFPRHTSRIRRPTEVRCAESHST